jgi:hypothetical protein
MNIAILYNGFISEESNLDRMIQDIKYIKQYFSNVDVYISTYNIYGPLKNARRHGIIKNMNNFISQDKINILKKNNINLLIHNYNEIISIIDNKIRNNDMYFINKILNVNDPKIYDKYPSTNKYIKKNIHINTYLINRLSAYYLRFLNLCNLKDNYNYIFQTRFDMKNNINFNNILNISNDKYILSYYAGWAKINKIINFKNNKEFIICDDSQIIFKNIDINKIKNIFNIDTWINNLNYMKENNLFDYYTKYNQYLHRYCTILGFEFHYSINLNENNINNIIDLSNYHIRKILR